MYNKVIKLFYITVIIIVISASWDGTHIKFLYLIIIVIATQLALRHYKL